MRTEAEIAEMRLQVVQSQRLLAAPGAGRSIRQILRASPTLQTPGLRTGREHISVVLSNLVYAKDGRTATENGYHLAGTRRDDGKQNKVV